LPAERLLNAVRTGARHAANNPDLRATLVRVVAFFPFAIAYLALLPLVARAQMADGPQFMEFCWAQLVLAQVGR
jgi:hypothetical protein